MKGIKIFILMFYLFPTNLLAQDNSNTIDISYIYDNLSKPELLKGITHSEVKLNKVINETKISKKVSLKKKLVVLNAIGGLTDGHLSELISSTVNVLFNQNSAGTVYYIYHDSLENIESFLLNELCMSFDNSSSIELQKTKIVESIKTRYHRINIKNDLLKFKEKFTKFDCQP